MSNVERLFIIMNDSKLIVELLKNYVIPTKFRKYNEIKN